MVRIDHKLDNRATRLSGGEMQRVAIGRALVRKPAIYLMDEPLSSLDAKLRADLRLELKRIQRELGATLLYVTHDQIEAMTMADRIGILDDGRAGADRHAAEIYDNPANLHVAARLGQPAINLLPADLLPDAPAFRHHDHRRAHRAPDHRQGDTASRRRSRLDRASRRPEPPAHHAFDDHKLVTLADPHRAISPGDSKPYPARSPLFRRERQRDDRLKERT